MNQQRRAFHHRVGHETVRFGRAVMDLLTQPAFWVLTILGNMVTLLITLVVYHLEKGVNPQMRHFIDALWWAASTVTTVGYGDVTPQTTAGRLVGIVLMLVGTSMFFSYTALFASIIVKEGMDQ